MKLNQTDQNSMDPSMFETPQVANPEPLGIKFPQVPIDEPQPATDTITTPGQEMRTRKGGEATQEFADEIPGGERRDPPYSPPYPDQPKPRRQYPTKEGEEV